jgi:hypothetical protein
MSFFLKSIVKPAVAPKISLAANWTLAGRSLITHIPSYANMDEEINEFAERVELAGAEPYPYWRKVCLSLEQTLYK